MLAPEKTINFIYHHSQQTTRGIRENKRCQERIRKLGSFYHEVYKNLEKILNGKLTISNLTKVAKSVEPLINKKIDRDALRKKDSLICWFAENWPEIIQNVKEYHTNTSILDDYDEFSFNDPWELTLFNQF